MRFTEIGQQLRAYRLESGLRAEEIAARLGVSRAALYRYEKGEVIKLDTVKRLAELLRISPLSLLGIGVEYYNRPIGYFERVRQIEETTEQVLQVSGGVCYLLTSETYDAVLAEVLHEITDEAGPDGQAAQAAAEQVLGVLAARKQMYQLRRPGMITILPAGDMERLLRQGIFGSVPLPDRLRRKCRDVAAAEVENIARLLETEPMGLQFGLHVSGEITGAFKLLRTRDRATLAVNPFAPDSLPAGAAGVAMITASDEAVAAHQRSSEAIWRDSLKGGAAAAQLRRMLREVQGAERVASVAG